DVEINGQYKLDSDSVIDKSDIDSLSGSNVKAETMASVAKKAYEGLKIDEVGSAAEATYSFPLDMSISNTLTKTVDRGLYLCAPYKTNDLKHSYTFESFLVSVPTSQYITATKVDENGNVVSSGGSDEWKYDVELLLKSKAENLYGSFYIYKTLNTFNQSLGTASFVFEVNAYDEEDLVFSNVYTIDFDDASTQKRLIENVPAGTKVVVSEVYSGASYTQVVSDLIPATRTINELQPTINILDNDYQYVEFYNDYDNRLIEGGIGIENHFIKNNDNNAESEYKYTGNNLPSTNNQQESEGQ
ncbi:MAG: hypothetical protein IJ675_06600, partial [Pseudobutyrivibrio sp.]|nr:hypothetical protein [Pseudobutyrivibrio sp.]